jgi:hypothetical protein
MVRKIYIILALGVGSVSLAGWVYEPVVVYAGRRRPSTAPGTRRWVARTKRRCADHIGRPRHGVDPWREGDGIDVTVVVARQAYSGVRVHSIHGVQRRETRGSPSASRARTTGARGADRLAVAR